MTSEACDETPLLIAATVHGPCRFLAGPRIARALPAVFLPQRFPKFPSKPSPGLGFGHGVVAGEAAPAAGKGRCNDQDRPDRLGSDLPGKETRQPIQVYAYPA